jgi:hypothetical protein
VQAQKLVLSCPTCASTEVYYTCTPNCCFNHVCGNCSTTFEPVTAATGAKVSEVTPPSAPAEAGDPTVACAKCESTAVYATGDQRLVCGACRTVLVLEYTEVAPG